MMKKNEDQFFVADDIGEIEASSPYMNMTSQHSSRREHSKRMINEEESYTNESKGSYFAKNDQKVLITDQHSEKEAT